MRKHMNKSANDIPEFISDSSESRVPHFTFFLLALKKVILLTVLQQGANKCRYQGLPGADVSHRRERADQSS